MAQRVHLSEYQGVRKNGGLEAGSSPAVSRESTGLVLTPMSGVRALMQGPECSLAGSQERMEGQCVREVLASLSACQKDWDARLGAEGSRS